MHQRVALSPTAPNVRGAPVCASGGKTHGAAAPGHTGHDDHALFT
ncbi:hypothetical protein XVE_1508 [Xanthomonas vesicatoria ATCC 35937]|uniref:Uncharacterized protein n=1 Tax=Xanthomonas vesicatoria ATCC 35937 TaxID=925775 RepID=F0BBN6_9XANT|nr:hypothetical protein XVE_1508 [Xanthomonas vesicatoria ATCC 35937]